MERVRFFVFLWNLPPPVCWILFYFIFYIFWGVVLILLLFHVQVKFHLKKKIKSCVSHFFKCNVARWVWDDTKLNRFGIIVCDMSTAETTAMPSGISDLTYTWRHHCRADFWALTCKQKFEIWVLYIGSELNRLNNMHQSGSSRTILQKRGSSLFIDR